MKPQVKRSEDRDGRPVYSVEPGRPEGWSAIVFPEHSHVSAHFTRAEKVESGVYTLGDGTVSASIRGVQVLKYSAGDEFRHHLDLGFFLRKEDAIALGRALLALEN